MTGDHRNALRAFQDQLRRLNRAPATVALLMSTARELLRGLSVPVARVRRADLLRYVSRRTDQGVSAPVCAHEVYRLRAFFRALQAAGLTQRDPTEGLAVEHAGFQPRVIPGERAVARLLRAASKVAPNAPARVRALGLRDRAVLELGLAVGARASELSSAQVVDLDLQRGECLVRRAKRGEWRRLPLPPAALPHLSRYLLKGRPALLRRGRDKGALFVSKNGRRLRTDSVWSLVHRVGRKAGVHAYPHLLRHFLITGLARAGLAITLLRQVAGHRHWQTTVANYVHVELERDLRQAVLALDCARQRTGASSAHAPRPARPVRRSGGPAQRTRKRKRG